MPRSVDRLVRNVGQGIVHALKRRAARNGRSAGAELPEVLGAALDQEPDSGSFKALLASIPDVGTDDEFTLERDLLRRSR